MKQVIYLAGKITGEKDYKEKFKYYEYKYRLQGHTVLNPANLPNSELISWEDYLLICKTMLQVADTIVLLPNYKDSKGALKELQWAKEMNKKIVKEN